MPQPNWQQVTFEKGLNTFDRPSTLQDGETQALENFEWTPMGGITPRPAWQAAGSSPTGAPSSKRGRGLFTGYYQAGIRRLVATIWDNSANFVTYRTDVADPTAFTSYTQIDTVAVSSPSRNLPMAYAVGNGVLLMSNPGMTSGFMRYWNGTAAAALADAIAGRALVYFLNRFWTIGSLAEPTVLRFSEIGDHTNWNVSENFIPVAKDDGEPGEDIVIWDRGLLIAKQHSLHFLSGYTIDNFALAPIQGRFTVAPGRSMIPTEHGVFILGVDGNAYLYDGAEVQRISTSISVNRPTTGYMTGAWVGGKLYLSGTDTPTVAYAFDGARWRKETYADTSNCPQDLASYDDRYLLCSASNGSRLLSVREETGAFSTAGKRSPGTDTGVAETFTATTKEWWPKGPTGKSMVRSIYVRYHQWVAGTGVLTITPVVDGVEITAQAKTVGGKATVGDFADRVDFAATDDATRSGRCYALKFSCTPSSGQATYSIDEVLVKTVEDAGVR